MDLAIKVSIKMEKNMEMENSNGVIALNMKENFGKMIFRGKVI